MSWSALYVLKYVLSKPAISGQWPTAARPALCFSVYPCLQNASLAVLHDADFGSVESWDSWGQEPSDIDGRHTAEVNQETWLMLEYCDKGSLLVSRLLLGSMGHVYRA